MIRDGRTANHYEQYFTGNESSLALETDYVASRICLKSLDTCKEVLDFGFEDSVEPSVLTKTWLRETTTSIGRKPFVSREVGSPNNDTATHITTPPKEYWRDVYTYNRWTVRLTNRMDMVHDHGLEFGVVALGQTLSLQDFMLLSILLRDDGEIELSKHQELITAKPLKLGYDGLQKKDQDPQEVENVIAYANRAALLNLTLSAVARVTNQSDSLLVGGVTALQTLWADAYERIGGVEVASFEGYQYAPGLEFGPVAAYGRGGRNQT